MDRFSLNHLNLQIRKPFLRWNKKNIRKSNFKTEYTFSHGLGNIFCARWPSNSPCAFLVGIQRSTTPMSESIHKPFHRRGVSLENLGFTSERDVSNPIVLCRKRILGNKKPLPNLRMTFRNNIVWIVYVWCLKTQVHNILKITYVIVWNCKVW